MKLQTTAPNGKKTKANVESEKQPAEPQIEVATSEANAEENQFWEELELMAGIAAIERERLEIESEIEECQENVTACKMSLKDAESELSDVRDLHKDKTDELLALARKLLKSSEGKQLPETQSGKAIPEGWRALTTKQLLHGIKGLTVKKIDLIADLAENVGALKDLRGDASRQNKEFHEVLPKGIGKSVAQTIEDKLDEHIAKYQMQQANPQRQKLADDLLQEIRDLAAESRWTPGDCRPKQADSEDMHAGYTAFNDGQSHTSFLSEDRTRAREWMIGWVSAEIINQSETSKS